MDQETSEEKLFIKAGQIARHLQTDSSTATQQIAIYRGLIGSIDTIYQGIYRGYGNSDFQI